MRRALALLGVGVACWVAVGAAVPAARGGQTTADEPQYLMTALSLWEDHDLDVSDERREQRYRAFHAAGLPLQEETHDGGSRVSPHDPLLPALLAAPTGLGGWLAAKLALAALAGGLAVATAWVASQRFGVPLPVAVTTSAAFSAAAPLAVYGTQVYPELPAALAVVVAIGVITGPLDRRGVALLGAVLAALPWLGVKYVPVGASLALVAVVRLRRADGSRRAVALVAGLALAGAAFAVAHLAWYGGLTPYASGRHFAGELDVAGDPDYLGRATRLVGLLTDRDFGLLAWHPAVLLAVPALAWFARARPRGWDAVVVPLAVGWLEATFVALTMHGWWFPGRQVVVVLPCAVLVVAWAAARVPRLAAAVVAGGVLGASVFAWLVVQGVAGDLTLVVTHESVSHPIARAARLVLPDLRRSAAPDEVLQGVWTAGLALLAAVAWRRAPTATPGPRGGLHSRVVSANMAGTHER
jgi:hypothetical protein